MFDSISDLHNLLVLLLLLIPNNLLSLLIDGHPAMADRGVVCRYRGTETHCTDCLRVTVGTRPENEQFLSLLRTIALELGVQ